MKKSKKRKKGIERKVPLIDLKLLWFSVGLLNSSVQVPVLATFVGEQGFVQELGSWPEMGGDVGVGKVIQLNAHVGDVHACVEGLASVDAGAMGSIKHVSDAHPLQPGFVDCH